MAAQPLRERDNMATKEQSVFYTNVLNETGRDFSKQLNIMRRFAVKDPAGYLVVRDDVSEKVIDAWCNKMYDTVWDLFSEGKYGNTNIKLPKMGQANADLDWKPKFPASKINEIASKLALTVSEAFEEFLEEMMPLEFDKLTNQKLKAAGQMKLTTEAYTNMTNP